MTLSRLFLLNAIFSTLCGLDFLLFSGPIGSATGIPAAQLPGLGINLLVFAALLFWLSRRERVAPWMGWGIVAADALWVVGSAVLLATPNPLTATGTAGVVVVALIVGTFAALQARCLLRGAPVPAAGA